MAGFDKRVIFSEHQGYARYTVTYQPDDTTRESAWSRPDVPLLVYPGNAIDTSVRSHVYLNGTVAGAAGGQPVQLIYWGEWWNTAAGIARQNLITPAVQRLLASSYFSWLSQYGIPRAPSFRGAMVTTRRPPPTSASYHANTTDVLNLVWELIQDDVFPDPDDGPRICFIVLMPDGFTVTEGSVVGAHNDTYGKDGPFDVDRFWAGWVRPEPTDPMQTMVTVCHELTEMLVDPEDNGWKWKPDIPGDLKTELCDGSEGQNGYINDVRVQAYWSNAHNAPIIPLDRDYAAQLYARVRETSRRIQDEGTFNPASPLCSPDFPECCFGDRKYRWYHYAIEEQATVRLRWQRFQQPVAAWTINGHAISGENDLTIPVTMEVSSGMSSSIGPRNVTLHYKVRTDPAGLDIHPVAADGNFELDIACVVTDGAITGAPTVNVEAPLQITLDFRCAETLPENAYTDQLSRCHAAQIRKFIHQYKPTAKPGPGEPINEIAQIMAQGLPAYVRPTQFNQLAQLRDTARALHALLPEEEARRAVRDLLEQSPTLKAVHRWQTSRLHPKEPRSIERA